MCGDELHGIVSMGAAMGDDVSGNTLIYCILTEVSAYMDWINNVLDENGEKIIP